MKKIKLILTVFVLSFLLNGCTSEEKKAELLPASKEVFIYEVAEGVNQIAVDEEGLLYTAEFQLQESNGPVLAEDYVCHPPVQKFCVYDLEGNCIRQTEIELGNGFVQVMNVQNGVLYCIVSSNNTLCLFMVDTTSWEANLLAELKGFCMVSYMVPVGDYLYILGDYVQESSKSYLLHPDVVSYYYEGEQICRIKITEPESQLELMQVDFPISIYGTTRDTLMIYQYTEENGFGFLEFCPQTDTVTEAGWKNTATGMGMLSGCGEGYTFQYGRSIYYGTVDGMEAQLLPDGTYSLRPVVYQKGFVFFINSEATGRVERVCVEEMIKENKEIRILMYDVAMDFPYGCGFRMKKQILSQEEFALKVLAQDKDFDICMISSINPCAYNLKKNGVFYPLNDVEGVMEYLDACFPYVKEIAMDENGDIWMIPVEISIPGLLYNKEYCAENGIDYEKMDFLEFLSFTKEKKAEQSGKTSMSLMMAEEALFGQYLKAYDTFDTDIFRSYAKKFREIYQEQGIWGFDFDLSNELAKGRMPEFYYDYARYIYNYAICEKYLGASDSIGICGIPRVAEEIDNVGTVIFLGVNPQSDNLEVILNYITEFSGYMLTRKDSYILKDKSTYSDTPFAGELYELYAKGSLCFNMDGEVYWQTFGEYMCGEIELEDAIAEMERRRKLYTGE